MHSLVIDNKTYHSRLLLGTGKYESLSQTYQAIKASGAEIITFAIRRTNLSDNNSEKFLDVIKPSEFTLLPNTAGCFSAKDAVRTSLLARELLDGHDLIKLEVLGDKKTLYPNVSETLIAAQELIKHGFKIMVYTNDDPIVAKQLEELGCVAVMPLAAPIGSGLGIRNPHNIMLILDNAKVPIIVDAGVGTASDATIAMELGCDGILMNTAVAKAKKPLLMASAMKHAVISGREAFLAGRMQKKMFAVSSSPEEGLIFSE